MKNEINDKKLNIGLFIDAFFPMIDGVVNVVDNYAKQLSKYANVTVFTVRSRNKKYVEDRPYNVVRAKIFAVPGLDYDLGMPQFDSKFKKKLKEANLDIVHIHSPFSIGKAGVKYAKKHHIPCIATNHSQYKQDFYKATKSKLITKILLGKIMKVFNACDENWSVNGEVARIYDGYGLKKPAKVVNNATDLQLLTDVEYINSLKKQNNINDEKVFLFVGRLEKLKNIFFTLDALELLKNQGFKFKMFFIGSGQDEEKLRAAVNEKNMQDCVKLLGRISDRKMLAGYYNIADLFLFPSLYDCASLVQIEAASQKTPTIFIKGAATCDGIIDNENGYLSENDVDKFANRIIEIFNNDIIYKKVCENCYTKLYKNWEMQVKQAFEYYKTLIEKNFEKQKSTHRQ